MIALITATWEEVWGLRDRISNPNHNDLGGAELLMGQLLNKEVAICKSGVGIKRARKAASLLIQKHKPSLIVSTGHCGALVEDMRVGDMFIGTKAISVIKENQYDLYHDIESISCAKGAILTENRFIDQKEDKQRLYKMTNALCVDMETWGVVEAAIQSTTHVACIRSVSDMASQSLPDMGALYGENGRVDSRKALIYFTKNPKYLWSFIKFHNFDRKRASDSLFLNLMKIIPNL